MDDQATYRVLCPRCRQPLACLGKQWLRCTHRCGFPGYDASKVLMFTCCPKCGSADLTQESGRAGCVQCGLVLAWQVNPSLARHIAKVKPPIDFRTSTHLGDIVVWLSPDSEEGESVKFLCPWGLGVGAVLGLIVGPVFGWWGLLIGIILGGLAGLAITFFLCLENWRMCGWTLAILAVLVLVAFQLLPRYQSPFGWFDEKPQPAQVEKQPPAEVEKQWPTKVLPN